MPPQPDIALECSPFLARLVERHPRWFETLERDGRLAGDAPPQAGALEAEINAQGLEAGLRRFRNREMMRITWRELNTVASLEQTMADLSRLAEMCLQAACAHHAKTLRRRFGLPRDGEGREQSLVVLALGKLGGSELNLSSDIDVMFCYPRRGECDGPRHLSTDEFFTRQARAVVNSLGEVTPDGFCFRVDTRLRPFGASGPLVCSFGAMEQYYQREGRDWERYALIKARAVAGARAAGQEILRMLKPFVYRRYIDFGAVEALQEMLASVRGDAARSGRQGDIKRGPGGIREIEFLVQCLQLLRGGREPELQGNRLLEALRQFERLELLPPERIRALESDYRFLRRLENAVQALHDQQTHELPAGEDLERVARVMGADGVGALAEQLEAVRARVRAALDASFPRRGDDEAPTPRWESLLQDEPGLLNDPLRRFRERLARTALSQRATARMDRFLPMLMQRMQSHGLEDGVQSELLDLVLAICRRSAYLALLVQNPAALDRLLELFRESHWVAQSVIRHPALLDELIDPALGSSLPEPGEMQENADRILATHGDGEGAVDALNHMKLAFSLRIAVAELQSALTTPQAQGLLAALADVLVAACQRLGARMLHARHGAPPSPGMAIIAYGTLGARDISYDSDLDLIFLYGAGGESAGGERPLPPEQYFTRLVRRLLSLATSLTPAGRLYEVDTRLRPNGRAGLLVSSFSAFERYQAEQAWVWELQALVRARCVAGPQDLARRFDDIRRAVLARPREEGVLRATVADMRQRMRETLGGGDAFKHAGGGLVDIDFVAQLGVLSQAHAHPGLADQSDTCSHLELLARAGWLDAQDAGTLLDAHRLLVRARQLATLARDGGPGLPNLDASRAVCSRYLRGKAP